MAEKEARGILGLAQKAGRLASGDVGVREALNGGQTRLLLIATDVAPNTEKELRFLAEKRTVPVIKVMTREELGSCIGKAARAAVAVTDQGFAGLITKKLHE